MSDSRGPIPAGPTGLLSNPILLTLHLSSYTNAGLSAPELVSFFTADFTFLFLFILGFTRCRVALARPGRRLRPSPNTSLGSRFTRSLMTATTHSGVSERKARVSHVYRWAGQVYWVCILYQSIELVAMSFTAYLSNVFRAIWLYPLVRITATSALFYFCMSLLEAVRPMEVKMRGRFRTAQGVMSVALFALGIADGALRVCENLTGILAVGIQLLIVINAFFWIGRSLWLFRDLGQPAKNLVLEFLIVVTMAITVMVASMSALVIGLFTPFVVKSIDEDIPVKQEATAAYYAVCLLILESMITCSMVVTAIVAGAEGRRGYGTRLREAEIVQ